MPIFKTRVINVPRPLIIGAIWVGACCTPLSAIADQEASNVAHVAAGPYGRCYAKSVPKHIYDPDDQRQAGQTYVYRVENKDDELIDTYDWFAQSILINCQAGHSPLVVRVGPWQRGHNPSDDHLAIAFYAGGKLIKKYSTLDISGSELNKKPSISKFRNASASVSHYTIFRDPPTLTKRTRNEGVMFVEEWVVNAVTIDGRVLEFDLSNGELN